ncbi:MAG: CHAT domain-containing protein, partial [Rhizobiaceae bacterium]
EGFGDELYRRYTPEMFHRVLETLATLDEVDSILISTNSPVIPWELVLPPAREGRDRQFLGIGYRLARWTPRDSGALSDRPGDVLVFDGIAAMAPVYSGARRLPFQTREIDMLKGIDGFVPVEGRYAALEALVRNPSRSFVHFSGHGMDGAGAEGKMPFSILLEDLAVDPLTWKRLAGGDHADGRRPFYFFNACDTGSANVTGGFVRGWGTTVLEAGAAGFIGGLWPLSDEAAADFAGDYYARLSTALASRDVYLADVLREVRSGFYRTGDPNYLAYSYYGDPNLRVTPGERSP